MKITFYKLCVLAFYGFSEFYINKKNIHKELDSESLLFLWQCIYNY